MQTIQQNNVVLANQQFYKKCSEIEKQRRFYKIDRQDYEKYNKEQNKSIEKDAFAIFGVISAVSLIGAAVLWTIGKAGGFEKFIDFAAKQTTEEDSLTQKAYAKICKLFKCEMHKHKNDVEITDKAVKHLMGIEEDLPSSIKNGQIYGAHDFKQMINALYGQKGKVVKVEKKANFIDICYEKYEEISSKKIQHLRVSIEEIKNDTEKLKIIKEILGFSEEQLNQLSNFLQDNKNIAIKMYQAIRELDKNIYKKTLGGVIDIDKVWLNKQIVEVAENPVSKSALETKLKALGLNESSIEEILDGKLNETLVEKLKKSKVYDKTIDQIKETWCQGELVATFNQQNNKNISSIDELDSKWIANYIAENFFSKDKANLNNDFIGTIQSLSGLSKNEKKALEEIVNTTLNNNKFFNNTLNEDSGESIKSLQELVQGWKTEKKKIKNIEHPKDANGKEDKNYCNGFWEVIFEDDTKTIFYVDNNTGNKELNELFSLLSNSDELYESKMLKIKNSRLKTFKEQVSEFNDERIGFIKSICADRQNNGIYEIEYQIHGSEIVNRKTVFLSEPLTIEEKEKMKKLFNIFTTTIGEKRGISEASDILGRKKMTRYQTLKSLSDIKNTISQNEFIEIAKKALEDGAVISQKDRTIKITGQYKGIVFEAFGEKTKNKKCVITRSVFPIASGMENHKEIVEELAKENILHQYPQLLVGLKLEDVVDLLKHEPSAQSIGMVLLYFCLTPFAILLGGPIERYKQNLKYEILQNKGIAIQEENKKPS